MKRNIREKKKPCRPNEIGCWESFSPDWIDGGDKWDYTGLMFTGYHHLKPRLPTAPFTMPITVRVVKTILTNFPSMDPESALWKRITDWFKGQDPEVLYPGLRREEADEVLEDMLEEGAPPLDEGAPEGVYDEDVLRDMDDQKMAEAPPEDEVIIGPDEELTPLQRVDPAPVDDPAPFTEPEPRESWFQRTSKDLRDRFRNQWQEFRGTDTSDFGDLDIWSPLDERAPEWQNIENDVDIDLGALEFDLDDLPRQEGPWRDEFPLDTDIYTYFPNEFPDVPEPGPGIQHDEVDVDEIQARLAQEREARRIARAGESAEPVDEFPGRSRAPSREAFEIEQRETERLAHEAMLADQEQRARELAQGTGEPVDAFPVEPGDAPPPYSVEIPEGHGGTGFIQPEGPHPPSGARPGAPPAGSRADRFARGQGVVIEPGVVTDPHPAPGGDLTLDDLLVEAANDALAHPRPAPPIDLSGIDEFHVLDNVNLPGRGVPSGAGGAGRLSGSGLSQQQLAPTSPGDIKDMYEAMSSPARNRVNAAMDRAMMNSTKIDVAGLEVGDIEFLQRAAPLFMQESFGSFAAGIALQLADLGMVLYAAYDITKTLMGVYESAMAGEKYDPQTNWRFDPHYWETDDGSFNTAALGHFFAKLTFGPLADIPDMIHAMNVTTENKIEYWIKSGWMEIPDPLGGNKKYYINPRTGETVDHGEDLPDLPDQGGSFRARDLTPYELMQNGIIPHATMASESFAQIPIIGSMISGATDWISMGVDPPKSGYISAWDAHDINKAHKTGRDVIWGPEAKYWRENQEEFDRTWGMVPEYIRNLYRNPHILPNHITGQYAEGDSNTYLIDRQFLPISMGGGIETQANWSGGMGDDDSPDYYFFKRAREPFAMESFDHYGVTDVEGMGNPYLHHGYDLDVPEDTGWHGWAHSFGQVPADEFHGRR